MVSSRLVETGVIRFIPGKLMVVSCSDRTFTCPGPIESGSSNDWAELVRAGDVVLVLGAEVTSKSARSRSHHHDSVEVPIFMSRTMSFGWIATHVLTTPNEALSDRSG